MADESDWIEIPLYYPAGVDWVIGQGGGNFIGRIDEHTVLKYPTSPGHLDQLELEDRMFRHLGPHPYLIKHIGMTADGLRLAFAQNGALGPFLASKTTTILQRLTWSKQIAEAIDFLHSKGIIHCDINLSNVLLDENLTVKLCDLQGRQFDDQRNPIIDGGASEYSKYRLPSAKEDEASELTDIFALGTAIYHVIHGHEVFPELDIFDHEDEIRQRLESRSFPPLDPSDGGDVIRKCWQSDYSSAHEVVQDLAKLIRQRESSLSSL